MNDSEARGRVDRSAELAEFCRCEWPRLVGALGFITNDGALAEELAQETMVRVCRHWRRVSTMDAPGAWTYRVALNLAHSHFRRASAGRRAQLRQQPVALVTGPDAATAIAVRDAVAALPDRMRAVVVLRFYNDMPIAEVASVLGCAPGTVKSMTSRAIDVLRATGLIDDEEAADVDAP